MQTQIRSLFWIVTWAAAVTVSAADVDAETVGKRYDNDPGYRQMVGDLKSVSLKHQAVEALAGATGFKVYDKNPVLVPGEHGAWDSGAIGSMTITYVDGLFHLYYEAWGPMHSTTRPEDYESLQIGHAVALDGVHWVKDPANPVVPQGAESEWDAHGTWDPYIIFEDGKFKMWYGGGIDNHCDWGYAESRDGRKFTKLGKISQLHNVEDDHVVHDTAANRYYMYYWDRQFEPKGLYRAESSDEKNFDFPNAKAIHIDGETPGNMYKFTHVVKEGDTWYMLYADFVRPSCSNSTTRLATSQDGLHWKSVNKHLFDGHDADVLHVGDDLYLAYFGPQGHFDQKDSNVRLALYRGKLRDLIDPKTTADGTATAPRADLAEMTKSAKPGEWQPYSGNPVLTRGEPGNWDETAIGSMSVVKVGDQFHLFYEAWGLHTIQIGHATSDDGVHWTKDPKNPIVGRSREGWDSGGTWDPFVLYEDGVFKIWYGATPSGAGPGHCQWGYVTSKDGTHFGERKQISNIPNGEVEDDHVVHDAGSGKYFMYYWDRNFEPMGLYRAESPNETDFDFAHAQPIKIEGLKYPHMYKFTHVVQEGGTWVMLFGDFVRPRCKDCWTGIATSTDGLHWDAKNTRVLICQDAEALKVSDDLYLMYYGPDGFFDGEGCDVRVALMKGNLIPSAKQGQ